MKGRTYFWERTWTPNYKPEPIVFQQYHHEMTDSFGQLHLVVECTMDCHWPFVVSPNGDISYVTRYKNDAHGNRTDICMSDGDGDCSAPETSRSKFFYDGLGRIIGEKHGDRSVCSDSDIDNLNSSDGCPWIYEYDDNGNLIYETDAAFALAPYADGHRTYYTYDELNRLYERIVYHGGILTALYMHHYDGSVEISDDHPIGNLSCEEVYYTPNETINTQQSKNCYAYDAMGRVIRKQVDHNIDGIGNSSTAFDYSYLRQGQLGSVDPDDSNPSAKTVSYWYDQFGRTQVISVDFVPVIEHIFYRTTGEINQIKYKDGPLLNLTYRDGSGEDRRLGRIYTEDGTLLDLTYDYDSVGNVASITDAITGDEEKYTYDFLNRLTEFKVNDVPTQSFVYNSLGNRIEKHQGTSSKYAIFGQAFTHGSPGQHAVECIGSDSADPCNNADEKFFYDPNGNLVKITFPSSGPLAPKIYTYRHNNKLSEATHAVTEARYFYGPQDEKIASVRDFDTPIFYLDQHFDKQDSIYNIHLTVNGKRLASIENGVLHYYVTDHLGSTRLVLNDIGELEMRYAYMPFGEFRIQDGPSEEYFRFLFNGNEMDASGLYDYNARSYRPEMGTFLQPDSVIPDFASPQSLNRYSYVMNNPLKYIDPTGNVSEDYDEYDDFGDPDPGDFFGEPEEPDLEVYDDDLLKKKILKKMVSEYSVLHSMVERDIENIQGLIEAHERLSSIAPFGGMSDIGFWTGIGGPKEWAETIGALSIGRIFGGARSFFGRIFGRAKPAKKPVLIGRWAGTSTIGHKYGFEIYDSAAVRAAQKIGISRIPNRVMTFLNRRWIRQMIREKREFNLLPGTRMGPGLEMELRELGRAGVDARLRWDLLPKGGY